MQRKLSSTGKPLTAGEPRPAGEPEPASEPRPAASRFSPSTLGRRPVAIRMTSASISASDSTAVFILKVMPRFSSSLRRRLAISLSSIGKHSFRYSITVTSEPKRWKTLANSIPMTPAPMMQSRLGRVDSCNSSVLVTTRGSLMSGNGSSFALLPVAIMMFLAVIVVGMAGAFVAMVSPQTEQEGPPDTEHVEALINEA